SRLGARAALASAPRSRRLALRWRGARWAEPPPTARHHAVPTRSQSGEFLPLLGSEDAVDVGPGGIEQHAHPRAHRVHERSALRHVARHDGIHLNDLRRRQTQLARKPFSYALGAQAVLPRSPHHPPAATKGMPVQQQAAVDRHPCNQSGSEGECDDERGYGPLTTAPGSRARHTRIGHRASTSAAYSESRLIGPVTSSIPLEDPSNSASTRSAVTPWLDARAMGASARSTPSVLAGIPTTRAVVTAMIAAAAAMAGR